MGDIKEEVRNGRVVTKEIAEAAAKKVADDRQEKLTEEMVKSITNSEYKRKKQLLKLQKNRENEKISKDKLTKVTALDEELKAGSHTPESYRKANEAIEKEERDALRKVDEEYYELENQLESQYPNLYRW
jgi:hypothetical protein